jgi:tetratricopeptide (TPR) repeat protein
VNPIPAETAYLFRHALVREAAYELQPPGERAALHALALAIIEELCGGAPEIESPRWSDRFEPHATDPYALELAEHAELAGEPSAGKAALYLYRAAELESRGFRHLSALQLFRKLAFHPGADEYMRAVAHLDGGLLHYKLGDLRSATREYDEAAKLIDPVRDITGYMVLKSNRVIVESHTDNGPQVADAHKEAAEFWGRRGDLKKQLLSLINFAVWHCEKGDHNVARETLQGVIARARESGFRRAEDAAVGTLAMLDSIDGRLAEAEAGLNRAIEIARESRNLPVELSWTCSLANLYRQQDRLELAERTYRGVIERAASNGLDARREFAEAYLAVVFAQAGRICDARQLWAPAWAATVARNDAYTTMHMRSGMNHALKLAGLPPLTPDGELPA